MSASTAPASQVALGPGPVINVLVDWYEQTLANLLAAPYVHIRSLPGGIHGGPGPIDLFSTDFNNLFTRDASGSVNGEDVDRDELKTRLLALHDHFNRASVSFHRESQGPKFATESGSVSSVLSWTSQNGKETEHVTTHATIVDEHGSRQIKSIDLRGRSDLFESGSD